MHLVPLSILAAALIAAATPSADPTEITLKVDPTSGNDAAGNFPAPLDSFPQLDITQGHGGDGPNLNEGKFNLHYNFTLSAQVSRIRRSQPESFPVGYRPGVSYAELGLATSNFTLCRGHLLYDNYVFTVIPPSSPGYVALGPSQSAFIFETEYFRGRWYIRFNDSNLNFASLRGRPQKGDRVATISGRGPRDAYILYLEIIPALAPGQSIDLQTDEDNATLEEPDIIRELL